MEHGAMSMTIRVMSSLMMNTIRMRLKKLSKLKLKKVKKHEQMQNRLPCPKMALVVSMPAAQQPLKPENLVLLAWRQSQKELRPMMNMANQLLWTKNTGKP